MAANWKGTPSSMWAWLAQRFSAVFALGLIVFHYFDPINQHAQNLLLAFVVFHAMLGIRIILLDLGLSGKKHESALVVLLLCGAVLVTAGALWNR